MSYDRYSITPIEEEWHDLMNWDEDCYTASPTNIRNGDRIDFLGPKIPGLQFPYVTSAPPSNYGGPSSFDNNVSAAPSINGSSSSYGHFHGTSPRFSSTATSPLVARDELRYFGSFDACDHMFPPLGEAAEPPLLDTSRERIMDSTSSLATAAGNFLNPHVSGSLQTFSNRDVVASQILASTGTQFDMFPTGESIAEGDEYNASTATAPIPIIRTHALSFNNSFDSYNQSRSFHDGRTRAITIPQPSDRLGSQISKLARVPPMLPSSPNAQRRSRSGTLSRSSSRSENRKARASPSPTSAHSFGFVSMQMDTQSGRMAASATSDGVQSRIPKGRKKGLDPKQRSEAALMRIIGSCSNCKKRKEKCDPGTPCKACLKHFKGDLVNNPCRNHALANLSEAFLSNRHGWHPTNRTLQKSLRTGECRVSTDITYKIPLHFGFGLPMSVEVHPVLTNGQLSCLHEHLVYSWPPQSSAPATHTQPVLPALLTASAHATLEHTLDAHLEHLVMSEFKAFPPYLSPLRILHRVYLFFRSLQKDSGSAHLLLQALKLLVLVHVGGDITLPKQTESDSLKQLVRCTMHVSEDYRPFPCLIRSQVGAVMPSLAGKLMKDVLKTLERVLFSRNGEHWPLALATLIIVLMTVESIQYHAAKLPYHDADDSDHPTTPIDGFDADDSAVNTILALYKACFEACHTRLHPSWQGDLDTDTGRTTPADDFVKSVREAISKDGVEGYLQGKVSEKRYDVDDMGFFFDRLVAQLLLLET